MRQTNLIYLVFFAFLLQTPIRCQEMTVFLGPTGYTYYEDERPLITEEVHSLLSENELAFTYWKRSRTMNTIGIFSSTVAVGTGIGILARDKNNDPPTSLYAASIGSTIISIILYLSANNQKKKAVLTYNKGLEKNISFKLIPTGNNLGLGLAIRF